MANFIHPTAIIGDNVILGDNNYIGAFCIIGDPAEHKKYWGQEKGKVIIGNNNIVTGLVTIDAGTEVPTIIEDNCFIGARSEVVEGVVVERNSVLSMGVFLSASTRIVDRASGEIFQGRVPAGSVVVPGTLPSTGGVSLYCAVIVKRVDEQTRAKTAINDLLRD